MSAKLPAGEAAPGQGRLTRPGRKYLLNNLELDNGYEYKVTGKINGNDVRDMLVGTFSTASTNDQTVSFSLKTIKAAEITKITTNSTSISSYDGGRRMRKSRKTRKLRKSKRTRKH
jgi:hypothetical protein